jgi:hypothetical protein
MALIKRGGYGRGVACHWVGLGGHARYCGGKEGLDDKFVEPLKIEGGGGDVNVEEGGIDVGVGGALDRVGEV